MVLGPLTESVLTVVVKLMYRYPTSYPDGPAAFASKLSEDAGWKASGGLEFLNDWKYKLGSELLTPFGRSQLCTSLSWRTPAQRSLS
jgi:hypothetical protein